MNKIFSKCAFAALLLHTIAAQAALDPHDATTTPTGWTWWLNQTPTQIAGRVAEGNHIVDLNRRSASGSGHDVVLIRNSGSFNQPTVTEYAKTRAEVNASLGSRRMTDLDPYVDAANTVRFNFVSVDNASDGKVWHWDSGLSAGSLRNLLSIRHLMPIDIDVYEHNGATLYSYVALAEDGSDWWLETDVTAAQLTARIDAVGGRIVSLARHANGRFTAAIVRSNSVHWWWGWGASAERVGEVLATTASRLIDLEPYVVNGQTRYVFVTIDNANAETRRLRNLSHAAYLNPGFGPDILRGFLVKESNGRTLAAMADTLPFQPLSSLKLLPYLHAFSEIDRGRATLGGSNVSWWRPTMNDPATSWDDRIDGTCYNSSSPNVVSGSAPLSSALPTMMWESHNRTLDSVLARFGVNNISARAQNEFGLTNTVMHSGCPTNDGSPTWISNRSTLRELGGIFEGVERLDFIRTPSVRDAFWQNMITIADPPVSYTSPITGRMTSVGRPLNFIMDLVQEEAGSDKSCHVLEFLRGVQIHGKGGGGGPSADEFGYSDNLYVSLPTKTGGTLGARTYVINWFMYRLKTPTGCPESEADDGGDCEALWSPETAARELFRKELYRVPIREALSTWTAACPPWPPFPGSPGG